MWMRPFLFLLIVSMSMTVWISKSIWSNKREANVSAIPDQGQAASTGRFLPSLGFLPNDSLLGFVKVKEGDFLMGSDPVTDSLFFDNEIWPGGSPRKIQRLPEFYISRYEGKTSITLWMSQENPLNIPYPEFHGPMLLPIPVGSIRNSGAGRRFH